MHVTIDHAKLTSAATKLEELANRIDGQKSRATSGTPIGLPTLGASPLGPKVRWMRDELPKLQGLAAIGLLLDTEGNGHATFDVNNNVDDIRAMLGETLANKSSDVRVWDKEGYEQYADLFSKWTEDPTVMASFYTTLGPEGTLRFMSNAAQDPQGYGLKPEVQQQLLDDLRDGLETATTSDDFDDVSFGHGLVDQATMDIEDVAREPGYNPSGALAFLLRDGHFDRPFLQTVATDLDQYERIEMDGAKGLWGTRPDNGANFGQFMPYGTAMTYDNLDPMSGLMSAMENDPEYALEFFSDDSHPEGIHTRSYYYIHDRNWDQDAYASITGVLDAATTDPDLISNPESTSARQAALLASRTVDYLSERDNFDSILERFEYVDNGAPESIAHILSTYMAGVDNALLPNANGDVDPGVFTLSSDAHNADMPNVPLFDRGSLEKLSLFAMASDDGFAELRNGLNDYRADKLSALADQVAGSPDDDFQSRLTTGLQADARLEGFFVHTIGEDKIHDGEEADKRTQGWIDFGSDVFDLLPVPGLDKMAEGTTKDIISAAVDRGKGDGKDAITDWLVHAEDDARANSTEAAESTLQQQSYLVATLLAERNLAGDPNIDVPSWDEYQAMNDGDQATVLSNLMSGKDGVGDHFSIDDYQQAYNAEFFDYFK